MQVLNCLIVEDELLAAKVIEDYISQLPGLKLMGICGDVFSATEKLRSQKIDLIFLDINLPKISGLDFIKTLSGNYKVIITTAYHEYAIDGFNLNAVDYLLKPIEFTRFVQAINKLTNAQNSTITEMSEQNEKPFYFFYSDKKKIKIYFENILYVESLKDYVKIYTEENKVVTKMQIGEIEVLLSKYDFLRLHKSYIVNLNKISAYKNDVIEISKITIPIGRIYKDQFKKAIKLREIRNL